MLNTTAVSASDLFLSWHVDYLRFHVLCCFWTSSRNSCNCCCFFYIEMLCYCNTWCASGSASCHMAKYSGWLWFIGTHVLTLNSLSSVWWCKLKVRYKVMSRSTDSTQFSVTRVTGSWFFFWSYVSFGIWDEMVQLQENIESLLEAQSQCQDC